MNEIYTAGWIGPYQGLFMISLIGVGIFCSIFFPIRAAKKRKEKNRIQKDDDILV